MIEIQHYEYHGRRLMVEFTCRRCKKTALRPLKDCMQSVDYFQGLYALAPPADWYDGGFYYPMFCKECKEAYDRFMNGEGENE